MTDPLGTVVRDFMKPDHILAPPDAQAICDRLTAEARAFVGHGTYRHNIEEADGVSRLSLILK